MVSEASGKVLAGWAEFRMLAKGTGYCTSSYYCCLSRMPNGLM